MASIKVVLYKSKKLKNDEYPVMIRINHHKLKYVSTGISAKESQWDQKECKLKRTKENHKRLNNYIESLRLKLEDKLLELQKSSKVFTVEDIASVCNTNESRITFYSYAETVIKQLTKATKLGNRDVYQTMLNKVKKYTNEKDFMFEEINYKWLKSFEVHCLSEEVSYNGLNVYMRTLRALFNKAIKEKVVGREHYPFGEYKIKLEKPKKRAISKDDIRKIKNLELPERSPLWHARNIFLFSFYTMGMSWVDIAHLKPENIKQGVLYYKRAKTGKEYKIKLTEQAQEIINIYSDKSKPGSFIFPIIQRSGDPEKTRLDIKNGLKNYNKYLGELAKEAGVDAQITSYVSRHSWATIANKSKVHIGVISEGLGHDDIKTTQAYLEEFGSDEVDEANLVITDL